MGLSSFAKDSLFPWLLSFLVDFHLLWLVACGSDSPSEISFLVPGIYIPSLFLGTQIWGSGERVLALHWDVWPGGGGPRLRDEGRCAWCRCTLMCTLHCICCPYYPLNLQCLFYSSQPWVLSGDSEREWGPFHGLPLDHGSVFTARIQRKGQWALA